MALLDELVKIGAERERRETAPEQPKKGAGHLLRTMAVAGGGSALGYGLAELLARNHSFFKPPTSPEVLAKRVGAAKIILPILSGTAVMLADRYRQKMNEQYSKVRGFGEREKR